MPKSPKLTPEQKAALELRDKLDARKPPTPVQAERIAAAAGRMVERRAKKTVAPTMKVSDLGGTSIKVHSDHSDDLGHELRVCDMFGTVNTGFAYALQVQLINAGQAPKQGVAACEKALNEGVAFVAGVMPEDEAQAALAAQMWTTHSAAMDLAGKMARADMRDAFSDYGNLMVKMQRTFVAQAEALSKLRSGGKQQVEVRYVYVDARNSQNVIGGEFRDQYARAHARGGSGVGTDAQSHAPGGPVPGLPFAPGVPVWSPDAEGHAVPVSGDQGQEALPDARGQGRSA